MTVTVRWGKATDVGRVRAVNQDAVGGNEWLCVVADGMGGHQGGEVASDIAVRTLIEADLSRATDALVHRVNEANTAVQDAAASDTALTGMGTTLTLVGVVDSEGGQRLAVANVGDSRTYLYADEQLIQITEDHSLVASLVRQGRLTAEQAETHPQRNVVTRALGIESSVLVDAWEVSPKVGDRYVLCTDGLTNELNDEQIAAVLRRLADPTEAAQELVRLANEHGGHDNITVAVVDVEEADEGSGEAGSILDRVGQPRRAILDSTTSQAVPAQDVRAGNPADGGIVSRMGRSATARSAGWVPKISWRVLAFSFVIVAIVAVAVIAIVEERSGSFFVDVLNEEVVVMKGKPGGTNLISPEVASQPLLPFASLTEADQVRVLANPTFDSLEKAEAFISGLEPVVDSAPTLPEPEIAPSSTDDIAG